MNPVDWIEYIRLPTPFALFKNGEELPIINSMGNPNSTLDLNFASGRGKDLSLSLDRMTPTKFALRHGLIFMSEMHSHGPEMSPHMASPAPAQRAAQMTMIWNDTDPVQTYPTDSSAGIIPPPWVKTNDDESFDGLNISPHREDGFPAVIVAGGLRKHFSGGKLHRKGAHPAIQADYVGAVWMRHGKYHRPNGPAAVLIKNYKEFHVNGEYRGYVHGDVEEGWDRDVSKFLKEQVRGDRNPRSNRYFMDPQEEFGVMNFT